MTSMTSAAVASVVVAFFLTPVARSLAVRFGMFDIPNLVPIRARTGGWFTSPTVIAAARGVPEAPSSRGVKVTV